MTIRTMDVHMTVYLILGSTRWTRTLNVPLGSVDDMLPRRALRRLVLADGCWLTGGPGAGFLAEEQAHAQPTRVLRPRLVCGSARLSNPKSRPKPTDARWLLAAGVRDVQLAASTATSTTRQTPDAATRSWGRAAEPWSVPRGGTERGKICAAPLWRSRGRGR